MPRPARYTTGAGEQLWEIRYRLPSGRSTRKRGFLSAGEAKRWWDRTGRKIAAGSLATHSDSNIKVRDWCAKWLLSYDNPSHKPRSVRNAKQAIRHINAEFGDRQLASVRPSDVAEWMAALPKRTSPRTGRTYAHKTILDIYRYLAQIFQAAVDDELLLRNPCTAKNRPKPGADEKRRDETVPTLEEIWSLHDAMEPRFRIAVILIAFVGLRPGEIVGLRVTDLDLTPGKAWIHPKVQHKDESLKTKHSDNRVPIPDWIAMELGQHLHEFPDPRGKHVVSNAETETRKGGQISYGHFWRKFDEARTRTAGGYPATYVYYRLRHFYDSYASHSGLSPVEVRDAMRHGSLRMQETYQHSLPGQDDRIRAVFASILRPNDVDTEHRP
jgi:integrase